MQKVCDQVCNCRAVKHGPSDSNLDTCMHCVSLPVYDSDHTCLKVEHCTIVPTIGPEAYRLLRHSHTARAVGVAESACNLATPQCY